MIVQSLKKKDKGYEVTINGKVYSFDEETIIKYRLVKDKELPDAFIEEIQASNLLESFKKKALSYHLRYMKSSLEVVEYLKTKGLSENLAIQAVEDLKRLNVLNDKTLAFQMASALARNSNGPLMIRQKLKFHLFESCLIEEVMQNLNADDISLGKEKLLKKAEKKFIKLSDFDKKRKIKEVFYRHGY